MLKLGKGGRGERHQLNESMKGKTLPSRSFQVHNTVACFPSDDQRETEPDRIHCHLGCPYHHQLKAKPLEKMLQSLIKMH